MCQGIEQLFASGIGGFGVRCCAECERVRDSRERQREAVSEVGGYRWGVEIVHATGYGRTDVFGEEAG